MGWFLVVLLLMLIRIFQILIGLDYRYLQTRAQWTRGQTNLGKDSYLTKQKITDSMLALNLMYFFN